MERKKSDEWVMLGEAEKTLAPVQKAEGISGFFGSALSTVKGVAGAVKDHFVGTEEDQPMQDMRPVSMSELDENGFVKL